MLLLLVELYWDVCCQVIKKYKRYTNLSWISEEIGNSGFYNTDIDMFIYGLSVEEANQKIYEIIEKVAQNTGNQGNCSHGDEC